jgi:hypothetical protein
MFSIVVRAMSASALSVKKAWWPETTRLDLKRRRRLRHLCFEP